MVLPSASAAPVDETANTAPMSATLKSFISVTSRWVGRPSEPPNQHPTIANEPFNSRLEKNSDLFLKLCQLEFHKR